MTLSKPLKISLAVLGAVAGLAVAAILAIWLYLGSESGQDWLMGQLESKAAQLGLELKIGGLETLFPASIRLAATELASQGRTFVRTKEMTLSLDPLALVRLRLKISSLTLVKPRLSLPLPAFPESEGEAGQLIIHNIIISDGALDPAGRWGPLANLAGVELTGRLRFTPRGLEGRVRVHGARLAFQGIAGPVDCTGEAVLTGKQVQVSKLSLATAAGLINLSGWLDWAQGLELDAQAVGPALNLQKLGLGKLDRNLLPPGPISLNLAAKGRLAGWLDFQTQAKLQEGSLTVEGRLNALVGAMTLKADLEKLNLSFWRAARHLEPVSGRFFLNSSGTLLSPDWSAGLEAELDHLTYQGLACSPARIKAKLAGELIQVTEFAAQVEKGNLGGKGWFNLKSRQYQATLALKNLKVPKAYQAKLPDWTGQALVQGQLEVKGRWPDLSGELSLADSRLLKDLSLKKAALRFKADLSKGIVTLNSVTANLDKGRLTGQGSLEIKTLKHSLTLNFEGLEPGRADIPGLPKWAGAALLSGRLEARGQGADLAGQLSLTDSRLAKGVTLAKLDIKGVWQDNNWRLEETGLKADWGKLSAKGRADIRSGDFEYRAEVSDLAGLKRHLAALGLNLPLEPAGHLHLAGRWLGSWTRPGGRLTADLGNVSLGKIKLSKAKVAADLDKAGGRVEMQTVGSLGRIDLKLSSPDPWADLLELNLSESLYQPRGQPAWKQQGHCGLNWDGRLVELTGLKMAQKDMNFSLTGRFNLKEGLPGAGQQVEARPALVQEALLEFNNDQGLNFLAEGLKVELDQLENRPVQGKATGPEWKQALLSTNFIVRATGARLKIEEKQLGRYKLVVANKGGLVTIKPAEVEMPNRKGRVEGVVDLRPGKGEHDLAIDLIGVSVETLFRIMGQAPKLSGPVDFKGRLTSRGTKMDEIIQGLSGTISLTGRDLTLKGLDIDETLDRISRNQTLGLIDLSFSVITGPLNLLFGGLLGFSNKDEDAAKTSQIKQLSATWDLTDGLALARDVAFSSTQYRMAFGGRLDLGKRQFRDFLVGVLNKRGCLKYSQAINGPFSDPEIEVAAMLVNQVIAPGLNIFKKVKKLVLQDDCRPYYKGWVAHPPGRN